MAAPLVRRAPSPALARSWAGPWGVGHPGFVAFAAVAPMIPMTVPGVITFAPVEPVPVPAKVPVECKTRQV